MRPAFQIFPNKKWVAATAHHYGNGSGNCIRLELKDERFETTHLTFFYSNEQEYAPFLKLLKEAINTLSDPNICGSCGQEIKKEEGK